MAKLLLFAIFSMVVIAVQCDSSRNCYYCLDACEVSKATQRRCGENIGSSHEAVCTTRVAKDSKTPNVAQRRCEVVSKGKEPTCDLNDVCTQCKNDLCNAAPSVVGSVAIVGIILAARLLFH